jgi:hypothetical protein
MWSSPKSTDADNRLSNYSQPDMLRITQPPAPDNDNLRNRRPVSRKIIDDNAKKISNGIDVFRGVAAAGGVSDAVSIKSTESVQGSASSSTFSNTTKFKGQQRSGPVLASFVATKPSVDEKFLLASTQAVVPSPPRRFRLLTPDISSDTKGKKGKGNFPPSSVRQNTRTLHPMDDAPRPMDNGPWAIRVPYHPGQKPPSPPTSPRRPSSASSSVSSTRAKQGSDPGSEQGSAGWYTSRRVHPEPIKGVVHTGHTLANEEASDKPGSTPKLVKINQVAPNATIRNPGKVPKGGSHKKRTRKHKKHISRHPTRRRRRIPPTEGHKYTRKHPRT